MRWHPRTALGRHLAEDRRFGIVTGSRWLLVMAAYYILLGVMRFGAVLTERRQSSERFVMRFCGGLLMALALVMGTATAVSLLEETAVPHGIIVMLVIAIYTFWKMTMAIIHTVQAHQSGTPLTCTIRNITLASALASLMTMQRSMLVSFEGEMTADAALILNICTGAAVCLLVFLLGLNMLFDEKGFEKITGSRLAQAKRKAAGTETTDTEK